MTSSESREDECLADQIFLFRPTEHRTKPSSGRDPTTVLIYGWGDGALRHLSKFAAGYRKLYPQARIIIVLGPIRNAMRQTKAERIESMMPVVSEVASGTDEQRILAHVMSNTGCLLYAATLEAYRQKFGGRAQLPHDLVVFDSTPGGVDFVRNVGRWSRAMAVGAAAKFPWPFWLTQVLCFASLCANRLLELLTGRQPTGVYASASVNDLQLESLSASRLYIYSKEDDIIPWYDIEQHAAEAREQGFRVLAEVFEGSTHVGHMRRDPERYWERIALTWSSEHSNI